MQGAVHALVDFLLAHASNAELDAEAMTRLSGELVPMARAEWRGLQTVLEYSDPHQFRAAFHWDARNGFTAPLKREEVLALTQRLMLQVLVCFSCYMILLLLYVGGLVVFL